MISFEALAGATVCICAPTRSAGVVAELERQLGLAGASVLAPVPPGGRLSVLDRVALTALHRRKIEQADAVVVANIDGYIGAGTAAEIAHAVRLGRPVMFLHDPPTVTVDRDTYAGLVGRTRFLELRPHRHIPPELATGCIVAVRAAGDEGEGAAAWFRVSEYLRLATRNEALAAIDPARAVPDADTDALAALLEARYPATAHTGYVVLDLEFIAEPGPSRDRGSAAQRPAVALLAVDRAGNIALAGDGRGGFALPGGEIGADEFPTDAAIRCAREQLGVPGASARLVVVDTDAGGRCPVFVFDIGDISEVSCAGPITGTGAQQAGWIAASSAEVAAMVGGRAASWIRAAAPSGLPEPGGPLVLLEQGQAPTSRLVWVWHEQLPEHVSVTQAGVWAFDRDGRVVLQHRVDAGRFALPAGRPEEDDRDLLASAAREAFEESQILIDQRRAVLLGYQVTYGNPAFPNGLAQARFAAPVLAYYPIAPDADPQLEGRRRPYRRYLVDSRRAAVLLDWGVHGQVQARAAEQAAREIGVPVDRPAAGGYRDHGDAHLPGQAPAWELVL